MVKVRGRNSNWKTVKQSAENWHVRAFVMSWCHTGATSQSWQGHATESRYSWSAGISLRQVMTYAWCWHDDDCDRHLAHPRDAVQSRCFEPWPDVTGNFRNFLVLVLLASCRQISIVDSSNGVFSSTNRLRWTVKIMLSLLSNFWSRTIRTKAQLPWLSTRMTLFMCSWHIWHIVVKLRRRKTPRTYYRFWKSRWNNELRCIGFGWLRSPISINQESEDNIELLPLYHVPCVTLCTLSLSCQTTLTKRQKKKKKKRLPDVSVPHAQSWPRWAHSVSDTRVMHGRARHQIRDWSESRRSRELLTPGTSDSCRPRGVVTRDFWPFLTVCLTVFPFEFRPRTFTIGFCGRKSFISELMILECSFSLNTGPCKSMMWEKNQIPASLCVYTPDFPGAPPPPPPQKKEVNDHCLVQTWKAFY